jgi:uncharacterized protein YpuA (DUF1002 family)
VALNSGALAAQYCYERRDTASQIHPGPEGTEKIKEPASYDVRRVVRSQEENLQLQQVGEDQVQRLQDEFEALEESRNHYRRQAWRLNMATNNLLHSHHQLEADLQDSRQKEFRARENLRGAQEEVRWTHGENARQQAVTKKKP